MYIPAHSTDHLAQIFTDIAKPDAFSRQQATQELKNYVASRGSPPAPGTLEQWEEQVGRHILAFTQSNDSPRKLAGIQIIDTVIQVMKEDPINNRGSLYRFYNYLISVLRDSSDKDILVATSKSLGRLTGTTGSALGDRFIEEQIPNFLEMISLDARSPFGAVLTLSELARYSPSSFFPHLPSTFSIISSLLGSPQFDIRNAAAQLLGAILEDMDLREFQRHSEDIQEFHFRIQQGLQSKTSAATLHGSLLALRQLLFNSGKFLEYKLLDTWEIVRNFNMHSNHEVRDAALDLLPTLASYDTQAFREGGFLDQVMSFLLPRLDTDDSTSAYLTIGRLSSVVPSELTGYIDPIFEKIHGVLLLYSRRELRDVDVVFQTIGFLAASLGSKIVQVVREELDLIFSRKLSRPLVTMLESITRHISILLIPIQDRLLDHLSLILRGDDYRPLGSSRSAPKVRSLYQGAGYSGPVQDITEKRRGKSPESRPSTVILALDVLGKFNFKGHVLNEFALTAVLPHLDSDDPLVRRSAAVSMCRILVGDPIRFQVSHRSRNVVSTMFDKLLSVGVVDSDPDVRKAVLVSLESNLDAMLAQPEYVRLLTIALHDEVVENRILAIDVVGRLAHGNPALVAPQLRKTLIRLLAELQYALTPRGKEDAIRILSALVSTTYIVVEDRASDILKALLQCIAEDSSILTMYALHCIGQLSAANANAVAVRIPSIMSTVLATLEGNTRSTGLAAALGCLGQLCTNCAFVITPIEAYPPLIPLLHGILRGESGPSVRHQVIRVIGLLGAINPNRMLRARRVVEVEYPPEEINILTTVDQTVIADSAADDPYQSVVIDLLIDILKQPAYSSHRHLAVDSITSIAKTCGVAFARFLPEIMPAFCSVIRASTPNLQNYYLAQLTVLVGAIKHHVRVCVTNIMDLVYDIWDTSSQHLALLVLIEVLAKTLSSEFGPYMSRLLPRLLRTLQDDNSDMLYATQIKVLKVLISFGQNLQEYLNLVILTVATTYERAYAPVLLRIQAIECLAELSRILDLYPYTSRIMHSLVNAIAIPDEGLRNAIIGSLCIFSYKLGPGFALFIPTLVKAIEVNNVEAPNLMSIISHIMRGEALPPLEPIPEMSELSPSGPVLLPNQQVVKQAWDISRIQDRRDSWLEWFVHLVAQMVKESTSISLRSCMNLFDAYPHISSQLFNPAFASCWWSLSESNQDDVVHSLEKVVSSEGVPADVAYSMLNLVEYMERHGTPLKLSNGALAEYCFKHRAYAKALHYQELHFFQDPSSGSIEALIEINAMLRQEDAALGTLNLARLNHNVEYLEEWYEKLGQWHDALNMYESKDQNNQASVLGRLRCLNGLGEWDQLGALTSTEWASGDMDFRTKLAPFGAVASWSMGDWKSLDEYCSIMRTDSPDRSFYKAVSSIHRNNLSRAVTKIMMARDLLDPEMTAFLDEDPDRLNQFTVRAQMLSEMEEIVLYKELADRPERQQAVRETWKKRLLGCQRDLDIWHRVLRVRALAVKPEDDTETIVRYANICRKAGRLRAAQRVMHSLVRPGEQGDKAPPEVVYAQVKLLWASGDRVTAFSSLRNFTQEMDRDSGSKEVMSRMLARCHLKYGNWRLDMDGGIDIKNATSVLHSHREATMLDPDWSKAWHTWALTNLELVRGSSSYPETHPAGSRTDHVVAAIDGFFNSIRLMYRDNLQDALRLLTLWFKFGAQPEITSVMSKGFKDVACSTWLEVVPQIIARIHTPVPAIRDTLINLLTDLGKEHPQALVYPLTVGAKSPSKPRQTVALSILERMRMHSPLLVEQAKLVGQELSRVAVTWSEHWHEALQSSAQHYFNGKPDALLAALQPLYEELEKGPSTMYEKQFSEKIAPLLFEARELCKRHLAQGDQKAFDQVWSIHIRVWQHLDKILPDAVAPVRPRNKKSLDLHYVSIRLLRAVDLELAVPGTYTSGGPLVKISRFKREIPVLDTKQRPRRLEVTGDNGKQYVFLLKGHEDLRQDERVMQVIGLVNRLLSREKESLNRRLHLQRYPVIPLAPDVGLIGWIDGIDTLHHLISEYRKKNSIMIDLEYRMILQDEPDYAKCPLKRKVEVFESAMSRTTGQDLYRVLWLKSDSSEAWVSRRSTYTRSLAVGSMVGYLLGVGDRHPANIMLGRQSGKVIHIDFGDCFEVALNRDQLPERVPFRLTRMLRNAMEVCGIQGGFKTACEITMTVLRANKESLLAVLEALVYDPLINWRLVKEDNHLTTVSSTVSSSLGSTDTGPTRRMMMNEVEILDGTDLRGAAREIRNERALGVYNRVEDKLTGRDFDPNEVLTVPQQVEKLVEEAVSTKNLCELFHGWSPFW